MPEHVALAADLVLICNSLAAGGIERVVSTLANEWSRRGRKVCVITLHDRQRFYELDPAVHHIIMDRAGVTRLAELIRWITTRLRAGSPPRWWIFRFLDNKLYAAVCERLFVAYHTFGYKFEAMLLRRALRRVRSPLVVALGTAMNIVALKACKGRGQRVIISERNDPRRLAHYRQWEIMARRHYNEADIVTANTRGALREMDKYVDAHKLAFLPNPLSHAKGLNGDEPAASAPFILNVGRMVADKAQDVLIEAFAQLGAEFLRWRLSLVGYGQMEEKLRTQARGLGLAGRVDWHGVVRDPYVYYRSATIFALPSRVEGTPNALLEAMSCGLPVVVSDGAPGMLELVEDGVTGLVVPVNDPTALASALRRLARNAELRRRLGEAARQRVSEHDLPQALTAWEAVLGLA